MPTWFRFYGSAYVMDDDVFSRVAAELRAAGVPSLADAHGDFLPPGEVLRWRRPVELALEPLRDLARRSAARRDGKFHGHARSSGELRRLYRASPWRIVRETGARRCLYIAGCAW